MNQSVQWSVDQVCRGVRGPGSVFSGHPYKSLFIYFLIHALHLYDGYYQEVSSLTNGNN